MKLEDKVISKTYTFSDPSGYGFTIEATNDPEFGGSGWTAVVTLTASGFSSAEDAVRHVALSAEAFLRQLKALK